MRLIITSVCVGTLFLASCREEKKQAPAKPTSGASNVSPSTTVEDVQKAVEEKAAEVSQQAKDLMERYIEELGNLGDVLTGVRSPPDVLANTPKITGLVDRLKEYKAQFDEMSPGTLDRLIEMSRSRLDPVVARVKEQMERLTGGAYEALRPTLKSVPILGD